VPATDVTAFVGAIQELLTPTEAVGEAARLFPEARILEIRFDDRPADAEQN
jgi:hypothetical protein